MAKILLAGESWIVQEHHIKGVDWFLQHTYDEGTRWLLDAWSPFHHVTHLPSHLVPSDFPETVEKLEEYDLIVLSDIGANSLLLHPAVTGRSEPRPNRLRVVEDYVARGGALLMVGGYMSFAGIDGRARYGQTPIERVLPVRISSIDDRAEIPEGFKPAVRIPDHSIVDGLPAYLPTMLFYNQVSAKEGAEVVLEHEGNPILAVHKYKRGRSAAFTPDAAPHGATPEFLEWEHFGRFWNNIVSWLVPSR